MTRRGAVSRRWLLALIAVGVSACSIAAPVDRANNPPMQLQLASDGLRVPSVDQQIDFGRAEAGVITAVSKLLQSQPASTDVNNECGAGTIKTVRYDAGLDLLFIEGNFQGWAAHKQGFITASGLSPALTRAQLEAAGITEFQQTSLGVEFEQTGVFGLLQEPTPNAPVDMLWAGVSCFFR